MSSTEGREPDHLAREAEKAALARAKAELDAEHEAMRAELAAIEEEERLEAEKLLQAVEIAKNSNSGSTDTSSSPAPSEGSKPAATASKTPKPSRAKAAEGPLKSVEDASISVSPISSDLDAKAESKEKKDKKKDKTAQNGDNTGDSTSKERKKGEKEKSATEASTTDDPNVISPKGGRKERKEKEKKAHKATGEAGEASSSNVVTSASESLGSDRKERKDKDKGAKQQQLSTSGPSSDPTKRSKDKPKNRDGSPSTSPKVAPEGDKKEKRDKLEHSSSSDKLVKVDHEKDKKVKKHGSSVPAAASSSNNDGKHDKEPAKPRGLLDRAPPTPSSSQEDISTKSGPRPLTRVESSLKIPVLDLSNRRISELPLDIGNCTYLTKLYLSRNMISDVNALSALTELNVLNVSNNSLVSFPVSLSTPKSKLKDLIVTDNRIQSLPASFSTLSFPVLTKLDLMGNKFSEIPAPFFTIVSLTSMNMSWNRITDVPKAISALVNLSSLLLHHNAIKRIASGICQLHKLTTLELQENMLSSIPESIADLSSLTSLDVSRNEIKDWPAAFNSDTQLSSLIRLDLSHNQITGAIPDDKFPEEPTLFPAIEELYLNNNQISGLPPRFWRNLATVAVLDLRNNQISEISTDIESFYSLSTLEIGANKLTTLPAQIGTLSNLQVLSFYGNQITSMPDITALEYLQYLNAGHNQISEVNLDGLASLEEVFLSGNPIKQLPETIGETCPNLKLLFAADLMLKKVPSGLSGSTLLEQIDFSNNRISEIPPALGDLESLKSISFAHCKLETSKDREVLKTPGKGPWDCIEFWQNFGQLLLVDLSYNKLKYIPKGLETKIGTECEIILIGNPLVSEEAKDGILLTPQLGKRFQVGWAEMLGRRPTMEDHFLWQGALDGNSNVDLFAVFDGHAAREAAQFCAEHMPDVLKAELAKHQAHGEKLPKLPKSDTLFANVFETVNLALEKHLSSIRDTSVKHCGSTAVVVLIIGDMMQVANVGDSRAVLNSGERCTVDHKPRAEVDRIRAHPGGFVTGDGTGRINEVLAVSRSLGDFYMHPWVTYQPHVLTKTLTKEEKYIILACDGIWDEVEDADAIAIVDPLVQAGELFRASAKLRDMAYCAGSDDNISVMIIKLNSK